MRICFFTYWLCVIAFVGFWNPSVCFHVVASEQTSDSLAIEPTHMSDIDDRTLVLSANEKMKPVPSTVQTNGLKEKEKEKTLLHVSGREQKKQLSGSCSFVDSLGSSLCSLVVVLVVFLGLIGVIRLCGGKNSCQSASLRIVDSLWVDSKNELVTISWGSKLILAARSSGTWTFLSELSEQSEIDVFLKEASCREYTSRKVFWRVVVDFFCRKTKANGLDKG